MSPWTPWQQNCGTHLATLQGCRQDPNQTTRLPAFQLRRSRALGPADRCWIWRCRCTETPPDRWRRSSPTAWLLQLRGPSPRSTCAEDFAKSIKIYKTFKPDVFLASHAWFYDPAGKYARLQKGEKPNPYIDPQGYQKWVANMEANWNKLMAEQKANPPSN